jgi:hypothetical protein
MPRWVVMVMFVAADEDCASADGEYALAVLGRGLIPQQSDQLPPLGLLALEHALSSVVARGVHGEKPRTRVRPRRAPPNSVCS